MKEKKVMVLLSAYNGERYIAQQLESILGQSWDNFEILVRDDGSVDHTAEVVKKYEETGKVHLECGQNVGFIKSFFWLVEHCGEADYYAYADQDDVWLPDKLAMAVELLEREDDEKPLLYFSNYDFYDGKMNFVSHQKNMSQRPSFRNALVDCITLGFNSVFNRAACDLMKRHIPQDSCGHDWWTYLLCAGLGGVVYDMRPTVCYRRHSESVSPGGMNFFRHQVWRIKKFLVEDRFANVRKMLREYEQYYGGQLSAENQKVLQLFTGRRHRFLSGIKKVFYPHMFRQTWVDELLLRVVFLTGKL